MKEQDAAAPAQALQAEATVPPPVSAGQMAVGIVIALVALVLAWATWRLPVQPTAMDGGARLVPSLCAGVLLLCGLWRHLKGYDPRCAGN